MTSKRSPGRPRSETAQQAILTATADLIAQDGYANTTIDAIAARAGVGKQTIYRWWPAKADVVLEASAGDAALIVPTPDQGSYAADLRSFLHTGYRMATDSRTADLLRALMIEAQTRPEFGQRFRETFLEPRRAVFAAITDRAAARGDLPKQPAADIVAEIVFGTLWYRLLATDVPPDDRLADNLIAILC